MSDTSTWPATAAKPLGATAPSAPATSENHDALRTGTRVDEFEIIRVLGAGGFGIVYLALDQVLLRYVAIKEYMPTALAGRGNGAKVSVRAAALAATFAIGLESFINEARLLASFDHPSLVKVHRFWKANGTAYMVMQFYPGQTLKEARREMSASPDEAWLRAFVEPLLGALEVLHAQGVYHRDIAPDNILLLPDGRPVLLDFGSARRVIGDRTQSLTAILKPNFAPIEQYADEAGMRQGPWTDLYALGATVYFMLTGQAPTPSVLRAVRDAMPALSIPGGAAFPGVPTEFLAAIDWTLALAPDDRPQSVTSMRQALSGEVVPPPPSMRHAAVPRLTLLEPDDDAAVFDPTVFGPDTAASPAQEIIPAPLQAETTLAPVLRRGGLAGLAVLVLAALGALGWGAWALGPAAAVPPDAASPAVRATSATGADALPPALARLPRTPEATVAPASSPPPLSVLPTVHMVPNSRTSAVPVAAAARAAVQVPVPVSVPVSAAPPATTPRRRLSEPPITNPTAPREAAPRSPKDICGDRNFFALAVCINRECQAPQLRAHPQCVESRRAEEQRQRRMEE